MSSRPLLIIDGDNLAHRAYHSTPKTVLGADGKIINAVVGFFGMLLNLWTQESPRQCFVAWDTLGVDTYRNRLWPAYQSGRVFEPDIVRQLDLLPEICRAFAFGVAKQAGCEADDLMASAAKAEVRQGGTALLYTTDRDAYQLVNEQITVLSPRRGSPVPDRIGPREVVERFGVLPQQVCDFKALSGDASDKIPGVRGIGPKSAAALLLKHGSLDAILPTLQRPEDAKAAMLFREVVCMQTEIEVVLPSGAPEWKGGAEVLRALGAERSAERAAEFAA